MPKKTHESRTKSTNTPFHLSVPNPFTTFLLGLSLLILFGIIGLFMMIPLVVDHYEHNDLIIELKEMDQNGLTKSRNSMKVCIFKPSHVGTPQFFFQLALL